MKGVVLAGGMGTRLRPLTLGTNKHLLPVWRWPMIYFPLKTLKEAGIEQVVIVTGPEWSGDFLRYVGSGEKLGFRSIAIEVQEKPGGIAEALGIAQPFVGDDRCVVILGDNIFEDNIRPAVERFVRQSRGAKIFLKEVPDPERFGVAELRGGRVVRIVEKPPREEAPSSYAVTGLYMYDSAVWDIVKGLKPSARGELEITDVNNAYVKRGVMSYEIVRGVWVDAGTHEARLQAEIVVQEWEKEGKWRPEF